MGVCPLPTIGDENLHQGVKSLVPKCRACKCWYVDGNLDTDRLPGNCILLVVALLDPEKPR